MRLRSDLVQLAHALRSSQGDSAAELIDNVILPRLASLPWVVSLIGSTGSGKSTLLNSIAGDVVSPAGPLRPTTRQPVVWAAPEHEANFEGWGQFRPSRHLLVRSLALVDTPDLDSDLVHHREIALKTALRSDALLFVTTAARYGDDLVWRTLTELADSVSLAIVLNRVPSRARGARNDLLSRLRGVGLAETPVFTIGEQRIDPDRRRLAPQSIQRILGFLRGIGAPDRRLLLERAADRVSAVAASALDEVRSINRQRSSALEAVRYRHVRELELVAARSTRWRRRRYEEARRTTEQAQAREMAGMALPDQQLEERLESGLHSLTEATFDDLPV